MRLILLLLVWLCGCSTAATISLVNGGEYEGRIRGGNADELIVETDSGLEAPIPRVEIADIDHPGNAAATIGGLLAAYGAVVFVNAVGNCSNEDNLPSEAAVGGCIGAFVPAGIGVPMFVWGLVTWLGSKGAESRDSASFTGTVPEVPRASAFDFASPMLPPGR